MRPKSMLRLSLPVALLVLLLALCAGSCGVDFSPDDFCLKCTTAEDCGAGYVCEHEDGVGFCVPEAEADRAASPCYAQ